MQGTHIDLETSPMTDQPRPNIAIYFADYQSIYVHDNFDVNNGPIAHLITIHDKVTDLRYWINPDRILWIGPRA